MSQAELAASAIARLEAGGTVPTLTVLGRLATAPEVRLTVTFAA